MQQGEPSVTHTSKHTYTHPSAQTAVTPLACRPNQPQVVIYRRPQRPTHDFESQGTGPGWDQAGGTRPLYSAALRTRGGARNPNITPHLLTNSSLVKGLKCLLEPEWVIKM